MYTWPKRSVPNPAMQTLKRQARPRTLPISNKPDKTIRDIVRRLTPRLVFLVPVLVLVLVRVLVRVPKVRFYYSPYRR